MILNISPPLPSQRYVQQVVDSSLYHTGTLNNTILLASNELVYQWPKSTEKTLQKCKRLLDYAEIFPNTFIPYYVSDMRLYFNYYALHLVGTGTKISVAEYYYFRNWPDYKPVRQLNNPILV